MILSASYYVQQLFSFYRGTNYVPSTLPPENGPVLWTVVRDNTTSQSYIKVRPFPLSLSFSSVHFHSLNAYPIPANVLQIANSSPDPATLTFTFPSTVSANATVIALSSPTDDGNATNTPDHPDEVVPQTSSVTAAANTVSWDAPAWSFSVLVVGDA